MRKYILGETVSYIEFLFVGYSGATHPEIKECIDQL